MQSFAELLAEALETSPSKDAMSVLDEVQLRPEGFSAAINELADHYASSTITCVVNASGSNSMVSAPAAARLKALFFNADEFSEENEQDMIRSFTLVHGSNALEKQPAYIGPKDHVLIICDALDGSGTIIPVVERINSVGAHIMGIGALAQFCDDSYLDQLYALGVDDIFALAKA